MTSDSACERARSLGVPIVVLKTDGVKWAPAPRSHIQGSLAGDDALIDAALRQSGAIRVENPTELLSLLALQRYVIRSDLIFASPTDIALNFYDMGQSGELWKHVRISALEFVLRYSTAAILGNLLGILLAFHRSSAQYIEPWLGALYATPMIALAPIFIVLLGIGIYSKITIIFIEAFFPITINTSHGIRSTERDLIDAAESFGATPSQVIRTVLLPNAYPFIIAGMRIAVARALAGVLISEMLFTGVFLLAGTSIILMASLARFERRVHRGGTSLCRRNGRPVPSLT